MRSEFSPASRPAIVEDRRYQLEQLYTTNLHFIRDMASIDPLLFFEDIDRIVSSLAAHLDDYDGDVDDEQFQSWVATIVSPAVERLGFFYRLKRDCERPVRSAIRRVLGSSNQFDDYPARVNDIEAEVWIWSLKNLEKLRIPGRAKLSTRLYARAAIMARAWIKAQLVRLDATRRRIINDGGFSCEVLSKMELASMRADELEAVA